MSRRTVFLLTCLLFVLNAAAVSAGVGADGYVEIVRRPPSPVSLFCLPSGSGNIFARAVLFGGFFVDASIEVRVFDDLMRPRAGLPRQDIWLVWEHEGLVLCGGPAIPDIDPQADGTTYWIQPLHAGGSVDNSGGRLDFMVDGALPTYIGTAPVGFSCNSADINGDGRVDLADAGMFADDMFGALTIGAYAYRSDFNWDGVINVADAGRMSQALGDHCP